VIAGGSRGEHHTPALLLRRVAYGESDLILTLFTETLGRVTALARGAKNSRRRFGGSLEPMHTIHVRVDERSSSEMLHLRESRILTPRHRLVGSLDALDVAGRALNWLRRSSPPRLPEPTAWEAIVDFLDRLNDEGVREAKHELAEFGLRLLGVHGWGLELERCVRCGRSCPASQNAMIAPERGGLVCRECGGARRIVAGIARARIRDATAGVSPALAPEDVDVALELAERALEAHAGID
jgi:DNA repair protein RecO (recombination protein O)